MSKIWKTGIYTRVSKEDRDKAKSENCKSDSNSIQNQLELLKAFAASRDDMTIVGEFKEDGVSGKDYDRKEFKRLMKAIKEGKIDCCLVKDLSRLGRNFVETEKYQNIIFPKYGVRFIAVGNDVDSERQKSFNDTIASPITNLANEHFLAETSTKIRRSLEMKRRKGELVANFAVYGYVKNGKNLEIDPEAAEIVKQIFSMKIHGYSQQGIAEYLNGKRVLSPLEYKRSHGVRISEGFKSHEKATWSSVSVRRIIENIAYIGVLAQGKQTTPSYKDKRVILKDENQWAVMRNNHPAIISEADFSLANELLKKDLRIPPSGKNVYLLSGMLHCSKCGEVLIRTSTKQRGKTYAYYSCHNCKGVRISENALTDSVKAAVQSQITDVLELNVLLSELQKRDLDTGKIQSLDTRISNAEHQIKRYNTLKVSLYEALVNGTLSETEYTDMKSLYSLKIAEFEETANSLRTEIEKLSNAEFEATDWLDRFKEYGSNAENCGLSTIDRAMIVKLIDRIIVYSGSDIRIIFSFSDKYQNALSYAINAELLLGKAGA